MQASVWFKFFDGLVICQNSLCMGGKRDNKEWVLNWEHMFPGFLGYKRRSDIKKVDIMEFT